MEITGGYVLKIGGALCAATVIIVGGVASSASGQAAEPSAHAASALRIADEIDEALHRAPGGIQTSPDTIEWLDGTVTLTVVDPLAPQTVGTCASGDMCAFSGASLTGQKLAFTGCSTFSTTAITVASLADARIFGDMEAKNAGNTVLATVAAGGRLNAAPASVTKVACVP